MKMKKILCINLGFGGGCVFYANNLLYNLSVPKDVWINAYCDEPFERANLKLPMGKGFCSMLWQTTIILPFYLMRFLFSISKYEKILVFGPSNWDLAFILLGRLFRKSTFYIVHDGIMHVGDEQKFHQWSLYQCMNQSSHLIFLSNYVKVKVKEVFSIDKPSLILPHGIVTYSHFKCQIKELPILPTFTLIGRINYYKGITILIDSLPLLDFTKIGKIVIAGEMAYPIEIPKQFNKVQFVNKWLTNEEFDKFVNETDFLLMPYIEATQSGIAAVSIGYAKPAIVTRVGAMEEQLTEKSAYFMSDVSTMALVDSIMHACNDKKIYKSVQEELHALAKKHTWENLGAQLSSYILEN